MKAFLASILKITNTETLEQSSEGDCVSDEEKALLSSYELPETAEGDTNAVLGINTPTVTSLPNEFDSSEPFSHTHRLHHSFTAYRDPCDLYVQKKKVQIQKKKRLSM